MSKSLVKKNRDYRVETKDISETFLVHNGKEFVELIIEAGMVGYKLGSFVLTKQKLYHIHTKKNKKKKK